MNKREHERNECFDVRETDNERVNNVGRILTICFEKLTYFLLNRPRFVTGMLANDFQLFSDILFSFQITPRNSYLLRPSQTGSTDATLLTFCIVTKYKTITELSKVITLIAFVVSFVRVTVTSFNNAFGSSPCGCNFLAVEKIFL